MTGDQTTIDYEALAQDAMRNVIRTILTRVAKTGLPGDHHFYISFDTLAPGSSLSKRLKEKYPEEMTIVLQHRFWDLLVTEERFEVKLTFDGIPERLVVPFAAIKVFFDPSVRYGLQFEGPEFGPDATSHPVQDEASGERHAPTQLRPATTRSTSERKPRAPRKTSRTEKPAAETPPSSEAAVRPQPTPQPQPLRNSDPKPADRLTPKPLPVAEPRTDTTAAPAEPARGGGQVVNLDAFRKK